MGGAKLINPDEINKIIEERKQIPDYDDMSTMYKWDELVAALGDDEDDVFDYLSSIEDEVFFWIEEVYEEIIEKFPSERIEELFVKHHKSN